MSAAAAAAHSDVGVHRLIDMVVEEVSLVDRPANKQRFLIVKRDEEMAKSGSRSDKAAPPKGKAPKDKPPKDVEDPKDPVEDEEEEEDTIPPKPPAKDKKPAKKADDGSLLSAALSALEGLTEAVEMLATVGEEEAGPQLAELAKELDELGNRLAAAAGAPPDDAGEEEEGSPAAPAGKGDDAVGKALAAVRETVKRVRAIVTAAESAAAKADTGGTGSGGAPPAPVAKGESASAELATELKSLRDTVQAQQQRIVTLEKGVPLPNSTPSDERPKPRPEEDDASWPMDMNRPRDRTSVDKATSFHDEN